MAVQASAQGTVDELNVKVGDVVSKGQQLAIVSTQKYLPNGMSLHSRVLRELVADCDLLEKQLQDEQAANSRLVALSSVRREQLLSQLSSIESRTTSLQGVVKLQGAALERSRELLTEGFISRPATERAELDAATASDVYQAALQEKARLKGEYSALLVSEELRIQSYEQRQTSLRSTLSQRHREIVTAEAGQSFVLKAPEGGTVTKVQAAPGATVDAGSVLISLSPLRAQYQAVILIPSRSMAFVKAGMPVYISYDAFPYQKFGMQKGELSEISGSVISAQNEVGPVRLLESSYKATVVMRGPLPMAYGEAVSIRPDMLIQANIVRDNRTIFEWIFDPIRAVAHRVNSL
ncbi:MULTISPECIES: HlyD family secretion protein [unclassified Rhizobacter]|uniref:HlyD family secretion protein n=1 Tax=unclassified Rhizobacter TaxID=2640088 RepID=UPI00138EFF78|nr:MULTISPECIES: HlyD family efflux transporter periplasmic adaptor subunit [unclassified Rhizobacter]